MAAIAGLVFGSLLSLVARESTARSKNPDAQSQRMLEADARFRRGVELTDARQYGDALVEFLAAYDAVPHYAVLYNIGMLQATLGETSKAVAAFDEYLRQGRPTLSAERRAEVEGMLKDLRNRLGTVSLEISPPDARVFLDSEDLGRAPATSLLLTSGAHNLVVSSPGYEVAHHRISVRAGERTLMRIALTPVSAATATGKIRAICPISALNLWLDGRRHGPVREDELLELRVGVHAFEFEGVGYSSQRGDVSVLAGRITELACTPTVPALTGSASATGPTPASGDSRVDPEAQRLWSYIAAGAGVVLAAGAVTSWFIGEHRFDEYRAEQARLKRRLDELPDDAQWFKDENRSHDILDAAYAWRLAAMGLGVGSASALAASGVLWFSGRGSAPGAGGANRSRMPLAVTWQAAW